MKGYLYAINPLTLFIQGQSLTIVLESTYTTQSFETGHDALAVIPKQPLDLILLGIGLPDISGIEVLQRIKETNPGIFLRSRKRPTSMQTRMVFP